MDGIPAEFYRVFWKDQSNLFIKAINTSYNRGRLALSQRRGLIKLIPKKNNILSKLKNWRTLTFLNIDYQIATKAIANRLKKVLPKLINHDHMGYRSISENIRLIEGLIRQTEDEKFHVYYYLSVSKKLLTP